MVEVLVDKLEAIVSPLEAPACPGAQLTSFEAFAMSEKAGGGSLTITFWRGSTGMEAILMWVAA
jgi:hypothetical protein